MRDDIEDDKLTRPRVKVVPIRCGERVSSSTHGADDVGRRILQNGELVQLILDAAKDTGPPVTVDEFKAWLDRVGNEHGPFHD
jgi:hypothetical protein